MGRNSVVGLRLAPRDEQLAPMIVTIAANSLNMAMLWPSQTIG